MMTDGTEFGRFMAAQEKTRTARAEFNSAQLKLDLAGIRERCAEVISQHQPVASLGLDRIALEKLLDYVVFGIGLRK